jgi:23S rRNA (adenine2503-C2)-methyltransferase
MNAPSVTNLTRTPEEWSEWAQKNGGRSFQGKQIFRWIQQRSVVDPEQMSDLPKALREKLVAEGVGAVLEASLVHASVDGTRKLLLTLKDGATVETVLLPSGIGTGAPNNTDADAASADTEEDDIDAIRVTQCISTQVGCAMGCVFCASGVAGLKRHMTADEIVSQVLLAKAHLKPGESLRNVVFMGMGEPLHNYESTARALRMLTHKDGIALSSRRVTVSTSGLVPEIKRLGEDFEGQVSLAVSLHATDDETRTRLMPINKKYPLTVLLPALRAYPLPKRRKITIEYTLVAGKNDTVPEARKLASLLRGIPVKINLIPMNPIEASSLGPTRTDAVLAFQDVLVQAGYACFIRKRRGDDVAAACGQLVLLGAKAKVRVNRD